MTARKEILRTTREGTYCSRCGTYATCLVLTMRDMDAGPDAGQNAFTMRTEETVAICAECVKGSAS